MQSDLAELWTAQRPSWRERWRRRARVNWPFVLGWTIVLAVAFLALAGPQLAPRDPLEQNSITRVGDEFVSPPFPPLAVPGFPLGSDQLGRDLFSQLLWAIRPTMTVVLAVAALRLALGTALGAAAGWATGRLGRILEALITVALTLPILIVALAVIALVGIDQGAWPFVVGLALTGWAETARIVREQVRIIRQLTFVEAARALGGSSLHIVGRHVLRQIGPLLWVLFALEVSSTLVVMAALGFLGYYLGGEIWVAVSDTAAQRFTGAPELGQMLSGTIGSLFQGPWRAFAAGGMIFVIILGFNLLAEGLRLGLAPDRVRQWSPLGWALGAARGFWGERVMDPLADRFGARRVQGAFAGLALVALLGGAAWWRMQAATTVTAGLPVPGGHLWASERRDPFGTLWTPAVGPQSATIRWDFRDGTGFSGGPVVGADGTVYVAGNRGALHAISPEGIPLWEAFLPAQPVGTPALAADGAIWVATTAGGVVGVTPQGQPMMFFEGGGQPATSGPIVAPDGTIFYAVGGSVQAVSPEGEGLWREQMITQPSSRAPHLSPSGEWLFLEGTAARAADGGDPGRGRLPSGTDQFAIAPDGGLFVRTNFGSSDSISQWRFEGDGATVVREIFWRERGRVVSGARDMGITGSGLLWLAFYFDQIEDAKVGWTNTGGDPLGLYAFPHQPTRPIGVDGDDTFYTCGLNRTRGPECLALRPGAEAPLWQLALPKAEAIRGGALVDRALYVATSDGVLYAVGEE